MAFYGTKNIQAGAWISITDNDITSIGIQVRTPYSTLIKATAGATAPTNFDGAWEIEASKAFDMEMNKIARGLPGANRIYAYCAQGASLTVDHD